MSTLAGQHRDERPAAPDRQEAQGANAGGRKAAGAWLPTRERSPGGRGHTLIARVRLIRVRPAPGTVGAASRQPPLAAGLAGGEGRGSGGDDEVAATVAMPAAATGEALGLVTDQPHRHGPASLPGGHATASGAAAWQCPPRRGGHVSWTLKRRNDRPDSDRIGPAMLDRANLSPSAPTGSPPTAYLARAELSVLPAKHARSVCHASAATPLTRPSRPCDRFICHGPLRLTRGCGTGGGGRRRRPGRRARLDRS
jgi:hypothetical protein